MKRSKVYVPGLILAGSAFLFSCKKTDLVAEGTTEVTNKKAEACELVAFRNNIISSTGSQYIFQKQLDPATGKLRQITAGVYQGGVITSIATFNVHWNAGSVAFTDAAATSDTVLIVSLNATGRAADVAAGNKPNVNYLPTSFEYSNNKLAVMKISLAGKYLTSRFVYDDKDNCVAINDDQQASEIPGRVEFTYDNKKADQQVYFDEPRPFSWNTYSLLQFSGFFPELQPSNLRTGVKVYWGNNYKAYDVQLINHQLNKGKLTKYEVSFGGSNPTIDQYAEWICNDASKN
ncbi:MAG: hypothetical protein WCF67_02235 [Chitinophagaceae bacterium]